MNKISDRLTRKALHSIAAIYMLYSNLLRIHVCDCDIKVSMHLHANFDVTIGLQIGFVLAGVTALASSHGCS